MEEPKTAWEYVVRELPKLKCKDARTSFINGGQLIETVFFFSNIAGIDCHPSFSHKDKHRLYTPLEGIDEFDVNSGYSWRHPKIKARLSITLRTKHTRVGGLQNWAEHRRTMEACGFGAAAILYAERAKMSVAIEERMRDLQNYERYLKQAQAL